MKRPTREILEDLRFNKHRLADYQREKIQGKHGRQWILPGGVVGTEEKLAQLHHEREQLIEELLHEDEELLHERLCLSCKDNPLSYDECYRLKELNADLDVIYVPRK